MERVGFTKSWRKELDSDIWKMPPLYHRVWHFLIQSVSWEPNTFPTKNLFSIHLNPGQNLFSIGQIIEGVSWMERNVIKRPNKKTILDILKWLEFHRMIVRESNGSGTFISICNWCKYQPKEKAKVTESIPQSIPQGIPEGVHTKEVKEKKETKEVLKDICTDEQKAVASELIRIVSLKRELKITPSQEKKWSNTIRLMNTRDGIDITQMLFSLVWYEKNWMNEYVPVIESAESFRKKWVKILNAIERDQRGGPTKKNGFKTKQQINDEIQDIGAALNERTKFNPYRILEAGNSSGDVDQNVRALPE